MSMHPDEEFEQLQAAVMATRFPALFIGSVVCLAALVILGLLGMTVLMFAEESGYDFLVAASIVAVFVALFGSALGGSLLGSGIAGLQARHDDVHILRVASFQLFFWRAVTLFTVLGMILGSLTNGFRNL